MSNRAKIQSTERPDTVHGRLLEAVHISGYSLERALKEFRWLLEDNRWQLCGPGFESIDEFLKTISLAQFKMAIADRKEISKLLADLRATQRKIAGALGVSQETVRRDVSDSNESNLLPTEDKNVPVDVSDPNESIRVSQPNDLTMHFSSEIDEWSTPSHVIGLVIRTLTVIDLDPCSDGESVPAGKHYIKSDDGLSQAWEGRVYMNPPYGRKIGDWTRRLIEHYHAGKVSEAIALVPSRTDTEWFREFYEFPRCFIHGRLKFGNGDNSAPFPSMAVYLGADVSHFAEVFGNIGDVYVSYKTASMERAIGEDTGD